MNAATFMNKTNPSEEFFERDACSKLEEILRRIPWLQGWKEVHSQHSSWDFEMSLPFPDGEVRFCVACKKELRPSGFPLLAHSAHLSSEGVTIPVLAMPWVSPRMAELCNEHGWSWYDLSGNYLLDVPRRLLLEHTGNKPLRRTLKQAANLSTPETGRIVCLLLQPEHAGKSWTQREIQKHCAPIVSLGLVNKVVRYLRDESLIEGQEGGLRVSEPLKLLMAWREAYRFKRHERMSYFTLLQGKELHNALSRLGQAHPLQVVYGAFSAADIQAPNVRQPKTWIYLSPRIEEEFRSVVSAKQIDSGENLVVLFPQDEGILAMSEPAPVGSERIPCTNPVQTYIDLYHCGGRGQEAAEALLEQRLKPAWKAAEVIA